MAVDQTLARPYAEALFDLAIDTDQLSTWDQALSDLSSIHGDSNFQDFISDPRTTTHACRQLLRDVLISAKPIWLVTLDTYADSFITLLLEEKRFNALPAIATIFHHKWMEHAGKKEAYVTIASLWSEPNKTALREALEKRLGTQVECYYQVDPNIKGGAIIGVDHWVLDGSVRAKLSRLRESLEKVG